MVETTSAVLEVRKLASIEDGIALLREVEFYGRHSHNMQDAQTPDSWHKFISTWVTHHGDWSITEHEKVTVIACMDRGISHEWVRHRVGSYTQESTRFVNYTKRGREPMFIRPKFSNPASDNIWTVSMEDAEVAYKTLLANGEPPQLARSVFPNSLKTTIVTTFNLRNWRHFFLARTCREAHPQIKEITVPLLEIFKSRIPLLYDDIVPDEPQSVSSAKTR